MTIEVKMNSTIHPTGGSGLVRENTPVSPVSLVKVDENSAKDDEKLVKGNEKSDSDDKKTLSEKVDQAVTSLNSSIQSVQRNLQFSVDKDLDQIVINVTDKETDEIVRQIPSEEVLDLARNLHDMVEDRNNGSKGSAEGVIFSSTA
jgi:flagellar protein FlaG